MLGYEPEWSKWHCVKVEMHLWVVCKDWCYRNLEKLGETWNWSRFISDEDERGYITLGEMGFYFKNEEDAVAFTLANTIRDNERI